MTLAPADATELTEMLQFLSDWLAHDRHHLQASLEGFVGTNTYGTRQPDDDLARFIFLSGGKMMASHSSARRDCPVSLDRGSTEPP
jgi:hypothetical protein